MEELTEMCVVYSMLSGRKHTWKVQKAGNTIIEGCVDELELLRNDKYYLQCNKCLADNVMFMLDAVKERIREMLLMDFKDLDRGILNPLDDDNEQQHNFCTAVKLLSESTRNRYTCVQKEMLNKMKHMTRKNKQIYHKMTENCLPMVRFRVFPNNNIPTEKVENDINNSFTEKNEENNNFISTKQVVLASSFVCKFGSKPVNLDKTCRLLDAKMKNVDACCIDGEYDDYIISMS